MNIHRREPEPDLFTRPRDPAAMAARNALATRFFGFLDAVKADSMRLWAQLSTGYDPVEITADAVVLAPVPRNSLPIAADDLPALERAAQRFLGRADARFEVRQ